MGCYHLDLPNGGAAIMCGKLGPHCADCARVGDFLCDYPVGADKTCDRAICEVHAAEVAPNVHYCPGHKSEWQRFRATGGVARVLANVVPYKAPSTK